MTLLARIRSTLNQLQRDVYWKGTVRLRLPIPLLKRRSRIINCVSIFVITYIILSLIQEDKWSLKRKQIHITKTEDNKGTENLTAPLFYTSPGYPELRGRDFSISRTSLKELNILTKDYVTMSDEVAADFVFATAASVAFFDMVKEAIVITLKMRPDNIIYVYDLGMSKMQAHEIKSMCRVKYLKFGFSIYPPHVRRKSNYAWKPLIIADVLTRHPGVFWMDSSVRLTSGDFGAILKQVQGIGALALTSTGHSTFAATNPAMYSYLPPGEPEALKREQQWEATILIYRTREIMKQVVKWMVLCALDEDCIAPKGAYRGCRWKTSDHYLEYGKCHRFDQSAFNLIMMNFIHGGSSWDYYASDRVCVVERYLRGNAGTPKYCAADRSEEDLGVPLMGGHEQEKEEDM